MRAPKLQGMQGTQTGKQKLKLSRVCGPSRPQWFSHLYYHRLNLASRAMYFARAEGAKRASIKHRNMAIDEAWKAATPEQKDSVELAFKQFQEEQERLENEGPTEEERAEYVFQLQRVSSLST